MKYTDLMEMLNKEKLRDEEILKHLDYIEALENLNIDYMKGGID